MGAVSVAAGRGEDGTPTPTRPPSATSATSTVTPMSAGTGVATVAVAAGLLSLNRFGGLVTQAPRAFVRLALVVVWGWIGLGIVLWLVTALLGRRRPRPADLVATLDAAGRAHVPVVALALVMFLFAGALRLRWPVLLATFGVVGWWFPRSVIVNLTTTAATVSTTRAIAATAVAYGAWLAVVGRHLHVQLGHLY